MRNDRVRTAITADTTTTETGARSATGAGGSSAGGPSRRQVVGLLTGALTALTIPGAATATASATRSGQLLATGRLFIGTYTSGGGTGIGLASYDTVTGAITSTGTLPGVGDPSYLAAHPDGTTLYAVDERQDGGVTAIALGEDGGHTVLGTRSTGGSSPCHLSVHPGGRWLFSANYGSGSVAVHPVEDSGALGERTGLVTHGEPAPGPGQNGPHAHQIVTSPDGGHVLAVDLGTDSVYTYRLDESAGTLGRVSYATLPPGAGPRHLVFHPSGRFAYVANELNNTITVCGYDPADGTLTPGEPSATGAGGAGDSFPSQPVITADGAFVYLANRGHNSLSRFAVTDDGAALRLLDTVPVGGDWPRQLALSPDGTLLFAANQRSNNVSVFHVDPTAGELTPAGAPFASPVAVCVLPLP
ncbi:lactonase family protein [Streptomyces sp. NBC_01498]|uniref:lactonase family protein n=1 Tax=Streptomyces sp. NBC_01498 TaxID=2975870 RepID=UPI002E7ADCAB|nr:lactonase family protein [Streptomyces sp. NBC_01498]WTL28528.1 lactonase family protein [Streptomyces sp. NBC_01498]